MNMSKPNFLFVIAMLLAGCGGGKKPVGENPSACAVTTTADTACEILNFGDGEAIGYKLPILYGQCAPGITEVNIGVAEQTYRLPVLDGYFKGAVLLEPGENELCMESVDGTASQTLNYEPTDNPQKVQLVYAIAADDDGRFLAAPGVANDLETAKQIIAVQGLMMQSATAEMMYRTTGVHQTFSLVEDVHGQPLIETFAVSETRDELYKMDGLDIYYSIQDQLQTEAQSLNKYLVIMGFSSYENGKTLAHAALGGGNLGIFGGTHLHTCPKSVDEISQRFSDNTLIDTSILPDDSAFRGTYWANCATGIGASLHELGHTFGLPHTDYGIMARGFDQFNRLFMITEPDYPSALTTDAEYDAVWHPDSIDILLNSPWLFP